MSKPQTNRQTKPKKPSSLPGLQPLREARGLTVQGLADEVGKRWGHIWAIENGKSGASRSLIDDFCAFFECSYNDLMCVPMASNAAATSESEEVAS